MVFDATVVIPAFNASATIAHALASVAAQGVMPSGGVIVVDDGSDDNTAEVASACGATVVRQAHGGPAAARNRGIAAATTTWIALLDADDRCTPDRFTKQASAADSVGERVAVIAGRPLRGKRALTATSGSVDFEALWRRNEIFTSTVLLRRKAWDDVGRFDEASELIGVEDYNLWLRLSKAGWDLMVLPDPLADYRPTEASLTRQTRRFADAEFANVRTLATTLGLSDEMVTAKNRALSRSYGVELLHYRDRHGARELLRRAAALGPLSWPERLRFLATWLPMRPR